MIKKTLSISVIAVTCLLAGCSNATITSAQMVYNRHSIKKTLDDHYIAWKASKQLNVETTQFSDSNIDVACFNRVVLIYGQAINESEKEAAQRIVEKIPNIREIHNLVTISAPASPLIHISDTWITTKIKSAIIASNETDPSLIKVITENGTVYLMGIVPKEDADIAVNIARTTAGVQNVVKIFDYLRMSKV